LQIFVFVSNQNVDAREKKISACKAWSNQVSRNGFSSKIKIKIVSFFDEIFAIFKKLKMTTRSDSNFSLSLTEQIWQQPLI
jgi:hypothetical protein